MTGIYLFGELYRAGADDVRPNVYEINGLQMLTGKGEWIWRPVANRDDPADLRLRRPEPARLRLAPAQPLLRYFQDDDQHWELRPSLWIEPIGDWGDGQVQLLEIPVRVGEQRQHHRVMAPEGGLAAGRRRSFAYRQFWCWTPPARPPLAICASVAHRQDRQEHRAS